MSKSKYIFVADRVDGFGARMNAVLSALSVANYYGSECRVIWREKIGRKWHSVGSISNVFSAAFIDKYCVEYSDVSSVIEFADFLRQRENPDPASTDKPIYVRVGFSVPEQWLNEVGPDVFKGLLKSSFKEIEFHSDVAEVVSLANNIEIGHGTVAVHLRAGDVIGLHRYSLNMGRKAVPYQLAASFLEKCAKEDRSVLLFGQDHGLCKSLTVYGNVLLADGLVDNTDWSALQREMFDITLISRCDLAFGGESSFLELGAAAAGKPLQTIYEIFSSQERRDIILADDAHENVKQAASAEQKLYSLWMIAADLLQSGDVNPNEVLPIVEKALQLAPKDDFLCLAKACLQAKAGAFADAEATLQALATESGHISIVVVLRRVSLPIPLLSEYLIPAADLNLPWACAFLVIAGAGDLSNATQYGKCAKEDAGVLGSNWDRPLRLAMRKNKRSRSVGGSKSQSAPDKSEELARLKLEQKIKSQQEKIESLQKDLSKVRQQLTLSAKKNKMIRKSMSWKLMAPLRWIEKRRK
jgi:hypothetical protein